MTTDMSRMHGTGHPIVMFQIEKGDYSIPERRLYHMKAIGFNAVREWMHIPDILSDPVTVREENFRLYREAIETYQRMDLEITGMSHRWFLAKSDGTYCPAHEEMYPRDTKDGSLYMQTLLAWQKSWETMARLFPEILQWEVGNEWNLDMFLQPVGYKLDPTVKPFNYAEKIDIAVDLTWYAYQGIKAGNPNAQVVLFPISVGMPENAGMPGVEDNSGSFCPSGYSIALTLSEIYARIESGRFPAGPVKDTNADHYFDMTSWHPYLLTQGQMPYMIREEYPPKGRYMHAEKMDTSWRMMSDYAYNIMCMHGDGAKKVLLSEMGFSDANDPERETEQAEMYTAMFDMIRDSMPYVKTVHIFGFYVEADPASAKAGGEVAEEYWGLYWGKKGRWQPRKKAYVLQQICGGSENLIYPADRLQA